MKRTRAAAASNASPPRDGPTQDCPFDGCTSSFDSQRALRAHLRRHRASTPFTCHVPNCSASFASHVRLDAHIGAAHPHLNPSARPRSPPHYDSDTGSPSPPADVYNSHPHGTDSDDAEARQLADNANYFFSQLRIARSRKLVAWNESDIRNAHMWAVWVQNEIHELEGDVSVEPAAERLLLDALLAYDGLDANLIGQIVRSAAEISADSGPPSQDAAEKGGGADGRVDGGGRAPDDSDSAPAPDSLSAVAGAAEAALRRKRAVAALAAAAGRSRAADASGAARGAVAAKQGLRTSGALALRAAAAGATVTDDVRAAARQRADWRRVSTREMGELCERDVTVLDAHVCALGREIVGGGRGAGEAMERAQALAQRGG